MSHFINWLKEIRGRVLILLLTFLAFSYAMFQGGFVSWFLFYSFLPFAVYAICLSFYSLKDFKVERVLVQRELFAQERLQLKIKLGRKIWFPLVYLQVEDNVNVPLMKQEGSKRLFFPWFRRQFQFDYVLHDLPRGEFRFEGIRLKTGDFFGFIEKEVFLPLHDQILVYPSYEQFPYQVVENQLYQGGAMSKQQLHRDSSMAVGVREYQPGDRFSWINWKATARRNEIMTKEFEHRQSHDVLIVLDCTPNPNFEAVVSFTASIIHAILKQGSRVGLLSSSNEKMMIPIRGGETQHRQLFYHLAKVTATANKGFDELFYRESLLTHHTLIIVTAVLSKELVEKLGNVASKQGTVILFLVKKKQEPVTNREHAFIASARAKQWIVTVVHEGEFSMNVSEVTES